MNTPRIYIADLAAYNAGHLHGKWIDATEDTSTIHSQIAELLKESPEEFSEEYAIHDYEGYGSICLHEYTGIKQAHDIAIFIQEYPEFGSELLSYLGDLKEAQRAAEENYCGHYESLADYAQSITEECMKIPAALEYYIDYEKMAHDMDCNGDYIVINSDTGGIHLVVNS